MIFLCLCAVAARADVFNMGSGLTNLETVVVTDPGNVPDTQYPPGYGAVPYYYRIGKYEVTAAQYCDFLNHKAKTDPYGLYETVMTSQYGCKIWRDGSSGSYSYNVGPDWANRPVNFVDYWDCLRFANWLHNGQGDGDTETGAYTLGGYNGSDGRWIQRNAGWKWAVTSENEWYKAAYYRGGGTNTGYWDCPTRTDATPSNNVTNPDWGNGANFYQGGYSIGAPFWQTIVGEFENSRSAYNTFDQAGNVAEWTDTVSTGGPSRVQRGGDWNRNSTYIRASSRGSGSPGAGGNAATGFRVAGILPPEFRAFWVDASNPGFLSQSQVDQLLGIPGNGSSTGDMRDANQNAVFVQVRRFAEVCYPSAMGEPYFSGLSPANFNALQAMISAAHDTTGGKQRIEVHCWIDLLRTWDRQYAPSPLYQSHSDPDDPDNYWVTLDTAGQETPDKALDPGHPGCEKYLTNVCMDIVNNFDIDGLHLDDISFAANDFGYNPTSVTRYNARYGLIGRPAPTDPQWQQWRRDQITGLVRRIYAKVQAAKPNVKVSGSFVTTNPAPPESTRAAFMNTRPYSDLYSDWDGWMTDGIVDMAVPMTFYNLAVDSVGYTSWLNFEKDRKHGRHMVIGQGFYLNTWANAFNELIKGRTASPAGNYAEGYSGYSYYEPYAGGAWSGFSGQLWEYCPYPADTPDMPWKSSPTTGHVSGTVILAVDSSGADGATVAISGPESRSTTCDGTGFYAFIGVTPGAYTLTSSKSGFVTSAHQVTVTAGATTVFNDSLASGPLEILNVCASDITYNSAIIKWTTNQTSSSQVEYGGTDSYGSITPVDTAQVTSHSVPISGLTGGTTYHYRVISGAVTSTDHTFTPNLPPSITDVEVGGGAGSPRRIVGAPASGFVGDYVTITGEHFKGAYRVDFYPAVSAQFTVDSDTQVTAIVPLGALAGPITVCTDAGMTKSPSTGDWITHLTNDFCAQAIEIPCTQTTTILQDTGTAQAGEDPAPSCVPGFGKGVWYKYQYSESENSALYIKTTGSDYDTGLAVFTGGCGSLSEALCNDDLPGETTSGISNFWVPAGATVWILAGGKTGASGRLRIEITPRVDKSTILTGATGYVLGNMNMFGTHYSAGTNLVSIELAGTTPKTEYGQISLGDSCSVASGTTLNTSVLSQFIPCPGQTFDIIVVNGTITGDFSTKTFTTVEGLQFQTAKVTDRIWQKYVITPASTLEHRSPGPGRSTAPPNTLLYMPSKVVSATNAAQGYLYVQESDRSAGIRVVTPPGTLVVGDLINVFGRINDRTVSPGIVVERQMSPASVAKAGSGSPPKPIFMPCRNIGGAALPPYVPGVYQGAGLNNIGLLASALGRVMYKNGTLIGIDDGSLGCEWTQEPGVYVQLPTGSPDPGMYSFVKVTGIVEGYVPAGEYVSKRFIRPRSPADVIILWGQ